MLCSWPGSPPGYKPPPSAILSTFFSPFPLTLTSPSTPPTYSSTISYICRGAQATSLVLGPPKQTSTTLFYYLYFCVSHRVLIAHANAQVVLNCYIFLIPPEAIQSQVISMPPQLLPASAAAFAPRASSVNVVLSSKVEPWLTQTLKRVNRVKRPLNSVPQHQRCLTETLSSSTAIWNLVSLMLPKPPSDRREDENPLVEAIFNYQLIHIEAYIVHVDMVLRNEVAFKLTPDTIEALIEYHKEVHCLDIAANTHSWSEKDMQVKKLHEEFVQAINKYVYRTHVSALEGLEEDGAGELLCGKSDEVKTSIMTLYLQLLPPPPRVVDVIRPPTLLPSSAANANWWSQPTVNASSPAPVDPWRVVPSSPNTSSASTSPDTQAFWASMNLSDIHVPSPPPAYSQPYSTAGLYFSSPPVSAPIPTLPLPSMLAQQQCGVSGGYGSFGGFGWDRFQDNYVTM